jgi:hypothetical protein
VDECLTREVCIDQYLWSVYQRAPKQDTIKVVERKKVTVKVDGKTRTVVKESTTLVDEDFAWKDPKTRQMGATSWSKLSPALPFSPLSRSASHIASKTHRQSEWHGLPPYLERHHSRRPGPEEAAQEAARPPMRLRLRVLMAIFH